MFMKNKGKRTKKNFSISLGGILILLIVIIVIFCIIFFKIKGKGNTVNMKQRYEYSSTEFSDSELKSVNKNENHKSAKKISEKDLKIGDIYCGMKSNDLVSVLGEYDEIYNRTGKEYEGLNYQTYRYSSKGFIIDVDKNTEEVKRISGYGSEIQTSRGIKIGSSVEDVLSKYHSEKKIGEYENNQGTYKVLYNSTGVFEYLYGQEVKKPSFGYIYEYNGKVYTIEYVEKDMSLKFDFLNGVVSNITISIK